MSISERIKLARGSKSQNLFAKEIEIPVSRLSRYEKKGDFPDEKFIGTLYRKYHINPTWLLFGEGEMLVSETTPKEKIDHEALQEKVKFLEEENKELTQLNRELTKHLLEEKNKVTNKAAIAG